MPHKIGIDLMGGERSPADLFEAVCSFAKRHSSDCHFTVFAQEGTPLSFASKNISIVFSGPSILMDDNPLAVVRRKKEASMAVAMRALAKKQIDALLSTGNTGALVAIARLYLNSFSQITRPALAALIPTPKKKAVLVDVGANVSFDVAHFIQYAWQGAAYARALFNQDKVSVALLNIGSEEQKGTRLAKGAYSALTCAFEKNPHIDFIGNIEGKQIFEGACDVAVTDGFSGNIFLKSAEGIAEFILSSLQEPPHSLISLFHPSEQSGALLCGLDGLVIKCHGNLETRALEKALEEALSLLKKKSLDAMHAFLS